MAGLAVAARVLSRGARPAVGRGGSAAWRVSAQRMSSAATAAPAAGGEAAAAAAAEEGWSLRSRVAGFAAFVAAGSSATFTYMLATDENFLFAARDRAPKLVNFFAPWAGLPVEEESGELDVEAFFPREISEIVGEKVQVACVLRSGRVVVVETIPDAPLAEIDQLLLKKLNVTSLVEDPVVSFSFLDADEAATYASKSDEELANAFRAKIPPLPAQGTASKAELQQLLNVYRRYELEYRTSEELARRTGDDTTQARRALVEIEALKKEVKVRIKSAQ
ncbi:Hypothetical Protein FCC1311_073812 [Hondaea fermentalgiana]|uniref:Uncharacterized protein n=1 Tax=Hondaea fermentalgiana TaxID=2315210 RepID=A0A2R5GJU7_9STRA|nr:Hypothetical Protein FCC1311_073812 [Hondaea fermentalgiana]|eukprot:GBG31160.1 Hypothetical Protein FCC1311_073812 [Hondaea fermentalgiana]